jgi:transglutaminase-like putative cysteine protease
MPIFKIHHVTRYDYDRPVKESINEIRIYPYQCPEQEMLEHDLVISGQPDILAFNDYWCNKTGIFNVMPLHKELVIESRLVVRTTLPSQLRINFHAGWGDLAQEVKKNMMLVELSTPDVIKSHKKIAEIVTLMAQGGRSVPAAVEFCNEYIYKYFKYIKGITNIETTVDEILHHKSGVCQDFAHLMLQVLRTARIPARYVSGYICPNKNGMRGEGATHAWVEAWLPGYGWAGIDPTNNVWVTNNHIKLAVGRNFNDCSPVKGAFKGPARQKLSIYVSVGYEDGHTFEELNNVQMEAIPSDPQEEVLVDPRFAVQQQQQQQQ